MKTHKMKTCYNFSFIVYKAKHFHDGMIRATETMGLKAP